jgi:hypothetical protein
MTGTASLKCQHECGLRSTPEAFEIRDYPVVAKDDDGVSGCLKIDRVRQPDLRLAAVP